MNANARYHPVFARFPTALTAADQIPLNLQARRSVLALLISSPVFLSTSRRKSPEWGSAGYLASVSAKSHACAVVANLRKQHHYGVVITYGNADSR
jgi:hypothetical protein